MVCFNVVPGNHLKNMTLNSQYWKHPMYKNPNVPNTAFRLQSISFFRSMTFCVNKSAAIVLMHVNATLVLMGFLIMNAFTKLLGDINVVLALVTSCMAIDMMDSYNLNRAVTSLRYESLRQCVYGYSNGKQSVCHATKMMTKKFLE